MPRPKDFLKESKSKKKSAAKQVHSPLHKLKATESNGKQFKD
jgi:hypothetical protein